MVMERTEQGLVDTDSGEFFPDSCPDDDLINAQLAEARETRDHEAPFAPDHGDVFVDDLMSMMPPSEDPVEKMGENLVSMAKAREEKEKGFAESYRVALEKAREEISKMDLDEKTVAWLKHALEGMDPKDQVSIALTASRLGLERGDASLLMFLTLGHFAGFMRNIETRLRSTGEDVLGSFDSAINMRMEALGDLAAKLEDANSNARALLDEETKKAEALIDRMSEVLFGKDGRGQFFIDSLDTAFGETTGQAIERMNEAMEKLLESRATKGLEEERKRTADMLEAAVSGVFEKLSDKAALDVTKSVRAALASSLDEMASSAKTAAAEFDKAAKAAGAVSREGLLKNLVWALGGACVTLGGLCAWLLTRM